LTDQAWQRPLERAILSSLSLAGGVSLAVVPAATLSISAHSFQTSQQGFVSVAITASTFFSQLAFAAIVESRLGSANTARRVTFPRWLVLLTFIAGSAIILLPSNPTVISLALPVLLASLEVGRGVSVAEHLDKREIWSAMLVGAGALGGISAAYLGFDWGFVPLAMGIIGATLVRSRRVEHRASRPELIVAAWVLTDVAITGIIYPVLNTFILLYVGATQSVLFAAISTVSGLLAIPLNFMRTRLLKSHSPFDIWLSMATVVVATVVIAILERTGVLGFIFKGSWTFEATVVPLAIACLWRMASLATTLPFASLRRGGHVRVLAVLRGSCAFATFVAGLAVIPLQSLAGIFVVMLCGELTQAALYEITRRRIRAISSPTEKLTQ